MQRFSEPVAADAADAAADPGIDQHHLADLAVLDLRADGNDLPGRLVAERQRQSDAAVGKAQALAAAEIVASFPDMQVRMANAGSLDRNDDLVAGGLRIRQVGFLQGIAESRQLEAFHPVVLLGDLLDVFSLATPVVVKSRRYHAVGARVAGAGKSTLAAISAYQL